MFFRSQKKLQGEVSLSETLETDKDGNDLSLLDVVGVEDTMLDDLDMKESHIQVRRLLNRTGSRYYPAAIWSKRENAPYAAGTGS